MGDLTPADKLALINHWTYNFKIRHNNTGMTYGIITYDDQSLPLLTLDYYTYAAMLESVYRLVYVRVWNTLR